jgi:hypothetical protein
MKKHIDALKLALEVLNSATPKYARQRKDQTELGGYLDYWKLEQSHRQKGIDCIKKALELQDRFLIGDKTMEKVFEPSQMTNLSDLQSVFDWVEKALVATENENLESAYQRGYMDGMSKRQE